jgi:HEPN domain-containing protein
MDKHLQLVKNWLYKAVHDMEMAKLAMEYKPELRDLICFHCQQSVEKALKAYLVYLDIPFRKTHSLTYLLDLLVEHENISDEMYSDLEKLESYAVEIRYPDNLYEPSEEEAKEALKIASKIVNFVINKIGTV